jgi:DNA adenine methylase
VEPFVGGMAVTLGLAPERALVNDINPHVVNFYQQLRRRFTIDMPLQNSRTAYDRARTRFNALLAKGQEQSREAAALFYYLNRTGYNGLCRFNQSGQFNVPFGRHHHIEYIRNFSPYREAFRNWTFLNVDFEEVPLRPGDFVYADPPYDVQFTSYAKEGFTWDDQVRVAEWLARHRGPVVLSNQATPRIVSLYRKLGFKLRYLQAPRLISCNGDRTPAKEVLATKNL